MEGMHPSFTTCGYRYRNALLNPILGLLVSINGVNEVTPDQK
jgi:hypothetical protein